MYYIIKNDFIVAVSDDIGNLPEDDDVKEIKNVSVNFYAQNEKYFTVSEGILVFDPEARTADLKRKELLAELDKLDLKSVRPLRAVISDNYTDTDVQKLREIETLAQTARTELAKLL